MMVLCWHLQPKDRILPVIGYSNIGTGLGLNLHWITNVDVITKISFLD
jgi:hypothetical protein